MTFIYVALLAAVLLFGLSAVGGLAWAVKTGQMDDLRSGAGSIFDDEEPVGRRTDSFPGGGKSS